MTRAHFLLSISAASEATYDAITRALATQSVIAGKYKTKTKKKKNKEPERQSKPLRSFRTITESYALNESL